MAANSHPPHQSHTASNANHGLVPTIGNNAATISNIKTICLRKWTPRSCSRHLPTLVPLSAVITVTQVRHLTPTVTAHGAPQGRRTNSKTFKLKCSTPFGQIDSNGHIEMQHKCGSNKSPWGFWINNNIQKRITGKVKERGMDSTVAGKRQGRQADHKVDKNYHFHGTFTAKDNHTIQYSDKFSFPVGLDIGTIKIAGKVKFTS